MKVYIKFVDSKGGRHIIAIETKYTTIYFRTVHFA